VASVVIENTCEGAVGVERAVRVHAAAEREHADLGSARDSHAVVPLEASDPLGASELLDASLALPSGATVNAELPHAAETAKARDKTNARTGLRQGISLHLSGCEELLATAPRRE
jgi:hypothetical protein